MTTRVTERSSFTATFWLITRVFRGLFYRDFFFSRLIDSSEHGKGRDVPLIPDIFIFLYFTHNVSFVVFSVPDITVIPVWILIRVCHKSHSH